MPATPAAARTLVLAALGLAAASGAWAQVTPAANVSAFNPYTGGGWGSAGQPRNYPASPAIMVPDATITASPSQGLAFNPWRRNVQPPASITPYGPYVERDPTENLPSPPPGPIRSRILAVPQRGDGPRRTVSIAPRPAPRAAARVDTVTTVAAMPPQAMAPPSRPRVAPPPRVAAAPPIVVAPRPDPPPATMAPAPAPPPPAVARATPAPATGPGPAARVLFDGQSAELSPAARAELDRIAAAITSRNARQIELRAYAGGTSPEARKVSLARALAVRSYLIDRGVRSRIDVGAFLADGNSGPSERVDIVAPNG